MDSVQKKYRSYLLRLWQVQQDEGIGLRASLEDVQTGELHGFDNLDTLMRYLQEQVSANNLDEDTLEKLSD
jgi:hypothetical protein